MNRQNLLVVVIGALALFLSAGHAKGQLLTQSGPCPGVMTFEVTGALPFSRLAFIHSANTGGWVIPPGLPCAGTATGLSAPVVLAGYVEADAAGEGSATAFIGGGVCGTRYLQVIDTLACTGTNVVLIN